MEEDDTTDGYHTMKELYAHRYILFIALCKEKSELAWRANIHDDGSSYNEYFIAGIHLPDGDISYHIPNEYWGLLDKSNIATTNKAPEWDGHTPNDVLTRLELFITGD